MRAGAGFRSVRPSGMMTARPDPEPAALMDEGNVYRPRDADAHPPYRHPAYGSTALRAPSQPPVATGQTLSEITGPRRLPGAEGDDADLTRNARAGGEPQGERIVVSGRVLDEDGRPVPDTLVEIWQTNAAGRYRHPADGHDAPLDPNFSGEGRTRTDREGRYRFVTVKPGAYPWGNHHNAWRPAHIHFSLFGPAWATRLVTQMYFPGDPLLALDPILQAVPGDDARARLVAAFSLEVTEPGRALGYEWDIVLRGRFETPALG